MTLCFKTSAIQSVFSSSYSALIASSRRHVYPFGRSRHSVWSDENVRRKFFDNLGRQLGVECPDDWYRIKLKEVLCGGRASRLIQEYYGCSLIRALQSLYPEQPWQIWKFEKVPQGFWTDFANIKSYFQWLAEELQMVQMSGWYDVTLEQVFSLKGSRVLAISGGLASLLLRLFPNHPWDLQRLCSLPCKSNSSSLSKSQRALGNCIKQLFFYEEESNAVHVNCRDPLKKSSRTFKCMELDVFIPSLCIGFEYQGEQHFLWTSKFGSPAPLKRKDIEKRSACEQAGITLIEIPFWWRSKSAHIQEAIRKARPDLLLWYHPEETDLAEYMYRPISNDLHHRFNQKTHIDRFPSKVENKSKGTVLYPALAVSSRFDQVL